MIDKKDRLKSLRELSRMEHGKALKEYLAEKLVSLNDISKITDYDDFRAKKEAKKIILEIFRFLNLTETQIKEQNKNQYL